jgi:hypothetical protein
VAGDHQCLAWSWILVIVGCTACVYWILRGKLRAEASCDQVSAGHDSSARHPGAGHGASRRAVRG